MSPTLTGLVALLTSSAVTAPHKPAVFPQTVTVDEVTEPNGSQEAIAGLDAPSTVKAVASGPKVHIESPRAVELFVVTGEAAAVSGNHSVHAVSYERVCDAPCGTRVPTRPDYFIGGRGVTPSRRFRVRSQDGDDVTFDVRPGRPALRWLGGASAVAGITMIIFGASLQATGLGRAPSNKGLIAGGAVLTAGSIPMFYFGSTRVKKR